MILKISQFRNAHEEKIKELYSREGIDSISLYCTVSYCPVIAAYWFCREFDPTNNELTKRIENIRLFYGIDEVVE